MTIYQEEMQRKALRYGCTTEYDAEEQLLTVAHNGIYLTGVTDKGYMHYTSKDLTDPESRKVFMHSSQGQYRKRIHPVLCRQGSVPWHKASDSQ